MQIVRHVHAPAQSIPDVQSLRYLRPRTSVGIIYFTAVSLTTVVAAWCALTLNLAGWLCGQALFALVFLQWFVMLHEAGHQTLFKNRLLNRIVGHIAGFFAIIPFQSWRYIHARHHRWTGWQDVDATTATLVPRALQHWERILIRICWVTYVPFSAIVYRLSNFWYLPRVKRYVSATQYLHIRKNTLLLLIAYGAVFSLIGVARLVSCCWLGMLLSLVAEDIILLSQHTHLPQHLSEGRETKPFLPAEQGEFTRSLRFPKWFSQLILHFDAHELHHMYVHVPGYDLTKIPHEPEHEVDWWTWLREAKRIPGDVFLFQNNRDTGFPW